MWAVESVLIGAGSSPYASAEWLAERPVTGTFAACDRAEGGRSERQVRSLRDGAVRPSKEAHAHGSRKFEPGIQQTLNFDGLRDAVFTNKANSWLDNRRLNFHS